MMLMSALESPCTKVCTIEPASGLCRGCGRSLDEIAGWTRFAPAERGRIMAELPRRMAVLQDRLAGRSPSAPFGAKRPAGAEPPR
jgi:predicted Fe-S protein YdhL (DUF1289 family)